MKYWLLSVFMLVALIIPISGQAQTEQESIHNQIDQWIKQLSTQDSRFAPFADAAYDEQGLKPSNQKLITFHSDTTILGYMVVQDQEKELSLLEYGLGSSPLFDRSVVAHFLSSKNEILHPYYAGLESVWASDKGIYDAKSGEKYLAAVAGHEHESVIPSMDKDSNLQSVFHKDAGNCLCWVKPKGPIDSQADLVKELKHNDVTLIADLFDSTVMAPYSVIGYHEWNGELFLELNDYGSRFIPYSYATTVGKLIE